MLDTTDNMVLLDKGLAKADSEELKIHSILFGWEDPPNDLSLNESPSCELDSPGGWSRFSFRPVFKKEKRIKKYKHHCLPTGCIQWECKKMENGKFLIGNSSTRVGQISQHLSPN